MAARTPARFCLDLAIVWRLAAWTKQRARSASDIRVRIEGFERFTEGGRVRYLSYATTPVGKKAPSLLDQTRAAVDCALAARALQDPERSRKLDQLVAAYEQFAWMEDPFEMGEYCHLMGHFLSDLPKRRKRGGKYRRCSLQRLPEPPPPLVTELLRMLGLPDVPPDTSDTLYFYLQFQDAMDELAVR
jgi:hypothetical protein